MHCFSVQPCRVQSRTQERDPDSVPKAEPNEEGAVRIGH